MIKGGVSCYTTEVSSRKWQSKVRLYVRFLGDGSGSLDWNGLVLVFTVWACSVENLWKEHRQREPLCHMTTEVNVHAEKEEEKRNNLFDTFFLSLYPPSLSLLHTLPHTLPHPLWRLLLLNRGHEKKAGMELPGDKQE